jgi:hypothetical protein
MKVDVIGLRYLSVLGVAMGLLLGVPYALAQEQQKSKEKPTHRIRTAAAVREKLSTPESSAARSIKPTNAEKPPYLGVGVEPLHPAFWTHLRDVLEHNQGVLVAEVIQGSPAAKAGIKPHDILMTFGPTKLHSPRELTKLVREEKAGDRVTLHILREGKPQEINVTLGNGAEHHTPAANARSLSHRYDGSPAEGQMQWESFDSMTLTKVGNDRFKVEIAYLDKQGKMEHRTFEGSRQQIQRDIQAQNDLPQEEQGELLRALDLRGNFQFDFPTVYNTPDGRMIWEF